MTVTEPDAERSGSVESDAVESDAAPAPQPPAPQPAVLARGLQLDGKRGRIYGPVDLTIEPGTLSLLTGPAGSGKTSLLLTLTGRMKPNRGTDLTVLGRKLPVRALGVQRRSAAVGFEGLDDLDEEVTVAAAVRERQAWLARWYRIVRTPGDDAIADVCASVFGADPAPKAKQLVHELDEVENLRLRLALALLSQPELIVVDEVDALHDLDSRRCLWESLRSLSELGITVIAAASTAGDLGRLGWSELPTHLSLPNHD